MRRQADSMKGASDPSVLSEVVRAVRCRVTGPWTLWLATLVGGLIAMTVSAGTSTRSGPRHYLPSERLVLTNEFAPLSGETGPNTLIERVPSGWTVGAIGEGGSYSATEGVIRWIFFGSAVRSITWEVIPPANPGATVVLSGTSSFGVPGTSVSQAVTGLGSMSLRPPPSGVATRTLPVTYRPGRIVAVTVSLAPESGIGLQVLEEQPPASWTVSGISDGGSLQAGKIRWGPFTDGLPRVLSYRLTAPEGASGQVLFSGSAQFGETTVVTTGSGPSPAGRIPAVD